MIQSRALNRRTEQRVHLFGKQVGWRKAEYRFKRRKGWMNDISPSGLSFLVESPRTPQIGESVEVRLNALGGPALWRVVRLQPMEGELTLVGCRRDPGSRSALNHPNAPGGKQAEIVITARSEPRPQETPQPAGVGFANAQSLPTNLA